MFLTLFVCAVDMKKLQVVSTVYKTHSTELTVVDEYCCYAFLVKGLVWRAEKSSNGNVAMPLAPPHNPDRYDVFDLASRICSTKQATTLIGGDSEKVVGLTA